MSVARPNRMRAVIALSIVTLIWGVTFTWQKQAVETTTRVLGASGSASGIALFTTIRFAVAALVVLAVFPGARRGPFGPVCRAGLWLGLLLAGGFALQMAGLEDVSPAVSAFLTCLYVVFTALISAFVERRAVRASLAIGAVLATIGAGLVRGRPELGFTRGELLTVVSALIFAVHILATDRFTRRLPPLAVTLAMFVWTALASALLLALVSLRAGAPDVAALRDLATSADFVLPLALAAFFATVVALTLMNVFQRELDPVRAAILYALEPIWAALFGMWFGFDHATVWLVVGGATLLAGNWIAEIGAARATSTERGTS